MACHGADCIYGDFNMAKRSIFRAFSKNRKGTAAIEFALVAPIFFSLVFATFEAGWYFFVNSAVEQANSNAARLIRTGQAQSTGLSREDFFNEICRVVDTFGSCEEKLTIDISSYNDFAALAADLSTPVCRDQDDPTIEGAQFDPTDFGAQRQIVRVRVCFLYKPLTPGIGLRLDTNAQGARQLVFVSVFRNEPFDS